MKIIWKHKEYSLQEFIDSQEVSEWMAAIQKVLVFCENNEPTFEFQSSGSTGRPKILTHEREVLMASARATIEYFGLTQHSKAFLALPAHLTGGAMMIIRAWLANMTLVIAKPSLIPEVGDLEVDFCPLTPAQLLTLWRNEPEELDKLGTILLGGSEVPALLEQELNRPNVFVGYGMTETASHVALRRLGQPYYDAVGPTTFSMGKEGELVIHAPHLKLIRLETKDLIALKDNTHFTYLGRKDFTINSGGLKIQPEPMEQTFAKAGINVVISSISDPVFGERPVAVFESEPFGMWRQVMESFPKYKRPMQGFVAGSFELNAGGKIDRLALRALIKSRPDRLFPLEEEQG
jgi:O-succinylbenzoic acid--CoA ligase